MLPGAGGSGLTRADLAMAIITGTAVFAGAVLEVVWLIRIPENMAKEVIFHWV
jgi:hypothetical protein